MRRSNGFKTHGKRTGPRGGTSIQGGMVGFEHPLAALNTWFDPAERARRRAQGKRARLSRKRNR